MALPAQWVASDSCDRWEGQYSVTLRLELVHLFQCFLPFDIHAPPPFGRSEPVFSLGMATLFTVPLRTRCWSSLHLVPGSQLLAAELLFIFVV